MKRVVLIVLTLCLILGLAACGDGSADSQQTTAATQGTTESVPETTEDDGKVTYTVKVVDEGGQAIANAAVQLCKESCLPGATDEDGVATFNVVEDDYKVSFMIMPEGYAADAEAFYFEDGSYEMTITLKAIA